MEEKRLRKKIRGWLLFFMLSLAVSGITAFPIEWELTFLKKISSEAGLFSPWINEVYSAVKTTGANFPLIFYGTDWLAFAHIVIAIFFVGPYTDPVKNVWIVKAGMIACLLVFPLAFICGYLRGIPLFWQLIDCSFGALGLIPLYIIRRNIYALEKLIN